METDEVQSVAAKRARPRASSEHAQTNATAAQKAAPGAKKTRRKRADKLPLPELDLGPRPNGRPPEYQPEIAQMARRCLLAFGGTLEELATFLGISRSTVTRWIDKHDDFRAAIKEGRAVADASVAEKLFRRACGYEHQVEKIFMHEGQPIVVSYVQRFPPDTLACIYWLNNRRPDLFRNRRGATVPDSVPECTSSNVLGLNIEVLNADERDQLHQLLLRMQGQPDRPAAPTARQGRRRRRARSGHLALLTDKAGTSR